MDGNQSNKANPIQMFLLFMIMLGIWGIFFQNAGLLPVKNTDIVQKLGQTLRIDGNVRVQNRVDANLEAINGHGDVFFNNPARGQKKKYYVLPVVIQNY